MNDGKSLFLYSNLFYQTLSKKNMNRFLTIFLFVLFFFSCEKNTKNNTVEDYYSTKLDTTYDIFDRTKIDRIDRSIYLKENEFKHLYSSLELYNTLGTNDFFISESKFNSKEANSNLVNLLIFRSAQEIESMFQKIDSVEVGKNLNERKKTKHYEISKSEWKIKITQFTDELDFGNRMWLDYEEYDGIKSAYFKYKSENN